MIQFQRPQALNFAKRLQEPRRFLQVLAGPRQVGKTTLARIASRIDLAGTKASVVQQRAEMKDYIDIDSLISSGVGLGSALAAAKIIYGGAFNPHITLKALSCYGDGNLRTLPPDVKARLLRAVKDVDLESLPILNVPRAGTSQLP